MRRPSSLVTEAALAILAVLAAAVPTAAAAAQAAAAPAAPAASPSISVVGGGTVSEEAAARVAAMTPAEKAATVVMGHIPTTDPAALRAYVLDTGVGGFILMGANIPADETQLRAITQALTIDPALPPLIGVDQEGGDVSRLPWDDFPSALDLKDAPPSAASDAFAARAALVQRAGIGVNFGVVADVASDTGAFIYRRSLGTTPDASAERVTAAVEAEQDEVATTLKHFPGHGAAAGDSHTLIPATDESLAAWRARDAVPFAAGIQAGAPLLMFGHLSFTAVDAAPASLSATWHDIARNELGFSGVAITDDLGMLQSTGRPEYADPVANAVAALRAGNDMVLIVMSSTRETASAVSSGIVAAVASGALPAARLDEAATRVVELRLQLAASGRGLVPCADCPPAG